MSAAPSEPPANGPEDVGWSDADRGRAPLRFHIPPGTPERACRSCLAPIFFVIVKAKKMPVNPDGVSHFATCPDAAKFRKPKPLPTGGLAVQLEAMKLGARIRAPHPIVYMDSGYEVAEGTLGTIRLVLHSGALVGVAWEGDEPGVLRKTLFTSLEAVQ